jgi:hypothetical protein
VEPDSVYFQESTSGGVVVFGIPGQAAVHQGRYCQSSDGRDRRYGKGVRLSTAFKGKRPWRACLQADCGHSNPLNAACTKSRTTQDVLQRTMNNQH